MYIDQKERRKNLDENRAEERTKRTNEKKTQIQKPKRKHISSVVFAYYSIHFV